MSLHAGGEARVVLVTAPDTEGAASLVRALLERRLIACGNIVPGLRSLYWWQGKICDEPEVLLVLKSARAHLEALEAAIVELHPYDTPEVLVLPVEAGSARYLEWLACALEPTRAS